MIKTAVKKDSQSVKDKVSGDELLDVLNEKRSDMHKYIYRKFYTAPSARRDVLLKKYSTFESIRDEIVQNVSVEIFEKIDTLQKEYIHFSLFNFLKYRVLNELYGYSMSKEIYDFGLYTDSGQLIGTYLNNVVDESYEETQTKEELQQNYESLLSHIGEVGLSDFEMKMLDYKFFIESDDKPTFKQMAAIFNKKESTVSMAYSKMMDKIREYFIINYDVRKLLNPAKSVSRVTNWTDEELQFLVNNYKNMKRKEVLAVLNKGRDKKITENHLKNIARKLGLTDSTLSDAGSLTIEDLKADNSLIQFTCNEDKYIHKNWHTVDHSKILEILNFKRDIKLSSDELESRAFMLLNKKRKKYERKN